MKTKRVSFFVLRGGRVLAVFLLILAVAALCFLPMLVRETSAEFFVPNAKWTVVVDAGHGGIDGNKRLLNF